MNSPLHLATAVERIAARHADTPAVMGDDEVISYGDLWSRACSIADALASTPVAPGRHVLLVFRNDPRFVEAYLACAIAGVVPACVYPDYGWGLLKSVAERTSAALILSDAAPKTGDVIRSYQELRGTPLPWIAFGSRDQMAAGATTVDEWLDADSLPAPRTADPSSILVTLCSSGTTGPPKLIPRSHEKFLMASRRFGELWNCTPQVRFGIASLITHAAALGWGVHPVLMQGGTLVIPRDRRPAALLDSFRTAGVDVSFMVPSHARAVLEEAENSGSRGRPFLRQLILGGEYLGPELASRLTYSVAPNIQNTYGMSEGVCTATAIDGLGEILRGSVGRPCLAQDEFLVKSTEGGVVSRGEAGELWFRSPACTDGYLGQPREACFSADGYLRTGDLVCELEDGSLSFIGRTKNMINRSGLKLYPELIENLLMTHPHVTAAAVVAVPDLRVGERVCAALSTDERGALGLNEINSYLASKGNGRVLQLDQVLLKPVLPSVASGKVDRQAIVGLFSERIPTEERT